MGNSNVWHLSRAATQNPHENLIVVSELGLVYLDLFCAKCISKNQLDLDSISLVTGIKIGVKSIPHVK